MTTATISTTRTLRGSVTIPRAKAWTHRAYICSLLSEGTSRIHNPLSCDDTYATRMACEAFGARIKSTESKTEVQGASVLRQPERVIDCRESGATLRFFLPIAGLCRGVSRFSMSESLSKRPIEPVLKALQALGVPTSIGQRVIEVNGNGLQGGTVHLPGNVSSQFLSGFLFAATRAEGTLKIIIESAQQSETYVSMTLAVLTRHKARIDHSANLREFKIGGSQRLTAANHEIPGDYSAASFMIAAACITGSTIRLRGLPEDDLQGDSQIIDLARHMGAKVERMGDIINIQCDVDRLQRVDFDARHTLDLVPALVVIACFADGQSTISGVDRLRLKESDRLDGIVSEFGKLGADVKVRGNQLIISGRDSLRGTDVNSHGDHRIAMALATAALRAEGTTQILGAECISKSYPDFFRDLVLLGGKVSF